MSHIIPEFIYEGLNLYDAQHKYFKSDIHKFVVDDSKYDRIPKGEYEGDILCSDCDSILLGRIESYATTVLFGKNDFCSNGGRITKNNSIAPVAVFENVDYVQFKLFLLSILWRASISKRDFFYNVKISEVHQENIRHMLYSNTAKDVNDYPIIVRSYKADETLPVAFIGQPKTEENLGMSAVTFLFGGLFITYYITEACEDANILYFQSIKKDNTLSIYFIPPEDCGVYLRKFMS